MKKEIIIAMIFLLMTATIGFVSAVEQSTTASVTVNTFLSVTLSNTPVTFPNMDPGTGPTAATVGNGYPLTATIGSESNVNANVGTKANAADFTGPATLAVSNMEWSSTAGGSYADYTTSNVQVCGNVAKSGTCSIYHHITIPSLQQAGSYSVGITVTATAV